MLAIDRAITFATVSTFVPSGEVSSSHSTAGCSEHTPRKGVQVLPEQAYKTFPA